MRPATTVRLVYAPAGDVIVPAAKPVSARPEYLPVEHARFVPTDARLCGDGGAGLFGESHSETVRSAARRGQSE